MKKSPATGRLVTLLTAPIKEGNRVLGILERPIELSDFSDSFVKPNHIGKIGYVYMFDGTGTVLAHPDQARILMSNIAQPNFGREMLSRDSGSVQYEFEGTTNTAHFRRSQKKAWTIVATEPTKEFLAGVRTIQSYLALFGILLLAGTVCAVLVTAGKVS